LLEAITTSFEVEDFTPLPVIEEWQANNCQPALVLPVVIRRNL
jgi:hypothetical protein